MLEHLTIRNLVLIERLDIDFTSGFTVISGETGAGKSIIVGAVDLLVGEKADGSIVRTGTDEALVSALFSIPPGHSLMAWLADKGIEVDDDAILINRTVKTNGRGTITVQSTPVTRADLAVIGEALLDMHGQHEHQSLLSAERQRRMLDSFGHLDGDVQTYGNSYHSMQAAKAALERFNQDSRQAKRDEDYLSFAFGELDRAGLKRGEDIELQEQLAVLSHHEAIHDQLETARENLSGAGTAPASELLANAISACRKAARLDPAIGALVQRLDSLWIEVKDVDEALRSMLSAMSYSAAKLDEMQSRLALLQRLKKKYGPTLDEAIAFRDDAKGKLESINDSGRALQELEQELARCSQQTSAMATALSVKRQRAADALQQQVVQRLRHLGMPNVVFTIAVEPKDISATGQDHVEFLFSANAGIPLGNLRQIASGGEMSRVMLAIKAVLASNDDVQTLVFDEVDAGIGGSVAIAVGEQLSELAQSRQVIAITHLASIAAKAGQHYTVVKESRAGNTYTTIQKTEAEGRIAELARMLSGDSCDAIALEHARHLLERH